MAEALHEEVFVEVQVWHKVCLVEEDDIRLFKGQGVFVGLVAAVGYADDEHFNIFSYVQFRGADEISYIFYEKDASFSEIHGVHRIVHQGGVQVAGAEGIDLGGGNISFLSRSVSMSDSMSPSMTYIWISYVS